MNYHFGDEGSWRLLIVTILATLGMGLSCCLSRVKRSQRSQTDTDETPPRRRNFTFLRECLKTFRFPIVFPVLLLFGFCAFVIVAVGKDKPRNMMSFAGIAFFITSGYIFSHNPSKVRWRPVLWGLALEASFALLILRTSTGRGAFQWLGDRVIEFLAHSDTGARFVFGDNLDDHRFAFKVLPVVVFFSTFVSVLYHLGVMQFIIRYLGRFLSICMGTAPAESISAAGNIFIGQTEAPLLVRPFLKDMTDSELHALLPENVDTRNIF